MELSPADIQRFWSKVALPDEGGCCLWMGAKTNRGYGNFGAQRRFWVATRVALELTSGPPVEGQTDAAHECRNRDCVAPAHLRWATRKENLDDKIRDNTMNYGERHGHAVLTEEQVREIRRRYAAGGVTQKALAEEFGVIRQAVNLIVNWKNWKHLPREEAS